MKKSCLFKNKVLHLSFKLFQQNQSNVTRLVYVANNARPWFFFFKKKKSQNFYDFFIEQIWVFPP